MWPILKNACALGAGLSWGKELDAGVRVAGFSYRLIRIFDKSFDVCKPWFMGALLLPWMSCGEAES